MSWLVAPPPVYAHPASWLVGNVLLNGAVATAAAFAWEPVTRMAPGAPRPVYYHRALLFAAPIAVWTTLRQAGRDGPLTDALTAYGAWRSAGDLTASIVLWLWTWGLLTGALRRAFGIRDAAG